MKQPDEERGGREGEENEQEAARPAFRFEELPSPFRENVEHLGWKEPMLVQERVIPLLLEGKDVVVQSRTGSGKTGAFLLPLCLRTDPRRAEVQGLVLVPTRELAGQVFGVLKDLTRGTELRSVAVFGGVAYGPQIEAFEKKVHIIVATPGRMIDHLGQKRVSLGHLRHLVLDEADEMLSMGFYPSISKILSYLPERRQTSLYSATVPPGVARLAQRFTRDPEMVSLSGDHLHVEEVDHVYYVTDPMYKDRAVLRIIEMENPEAALIFCNTKREVEYLGTFLKNFGYDGDFITGDLSQAERNRVMERIRTGRLRYLVATDVAARGIDISELGHVMLYSLPQAHDHYIHRAGRTGRAGGGGLAVSFVSPLEEIELKKRAAFHGLNLIRKELPADEEVERKVTERLQVMLEEHNRNLPNLERERLARFRPLARTFTEDEDRVEILAMLFDRFYQETLHKPLYAVEAEAPEKKPRAEGRHREKAGRRGGRPGRGGGGEARGRRDAGPGRGRSGRGGRRR